MIEFIRQHASAGWDLFKWILSGAVGLIVFGIKREIDAHSKRGEEEKEANKERDKRLKALEEWRVAQQARADLWMELGKPERRCKKQNGDCND